MHVGLLKPFLWYACFSPSWVLLRAHWPGGCSSWWQFGRNTVYWNGRDILCPRNFDALIPGSTMTRSNSSLFLWVLFDREENGNPLQCSCLENPRDGGAWWAAVHWVAQSRTWLKQLSSSSSSMNSKSLQLCLTLCDSVDCSLPDSPVHGILQAKILEWVAGPSFRGSSWPRDPTHVSCISCIDRWILYHQHHLGSPCLILFPVIWMN